MRVCLSKICLTGVLNSERIFTSMKSKALELKTIERGGKGTYNKIYFNSISILSALFSLSWDLKRHYIEQLYLILRTHNIYCPKNREIFLVPRSFLDLSHFSDFQFSNVCQTKNFCESRIIAETTGGFSDFDEL